jgi:hypothetical protein
MFGNIKAIIFAFISKGNTLLCAKEENFYDIGKNKLMRLFKEVTVIRKLRPCHSSSGLSPVSTAAAQGSIQVTSCVIYGGQSGMGQFFSEHFGSPCQFSFHRMLQTNLSSGSCYNRLIRGRGTKWAPFPFRATKQKECGLYDVILSPRAFYLMISFIN